MDAKARREERKRNHFLFPRRPSQDLPHSYTLPVSVACSPVWRIAVVHCRVTRLWVSSVAARVRLFTVPTAKILAAIVNASANASSPSVGLVWDSNVTWHLS